MELNWIKKELPVGWTLSIKVSDGVETVKLEDPNGYDINIPVLINPTLDDKVNAAIEFAKDIQAYVWKRTSPF